MWRSLQEGRTLYLLRSVMEELGLSVTWEEESRAVGVHTDDTSLELAIGSIGQGNQKYAATVAELSHWMARIVEDRTLYLSVLLPKPWVNVGWIETTQTVTISGTLPGENKEKKEPILSDI